MNSDTEDDAGKKLVSPSPGSIMILHLEFFQNVLNVLSLSTILGSRKVHGDVRLREGRTSGAVGQEWRHGPAD